MRIINRTENIIILILWFTSLATYPYAIFNNYNLFLSDYLGFIGLVILTLLSVYIPRFTLKGLTILLLFGLFNVFSFIYFVNYVFYFGFSTIATPRIQLLSFILISVLITKRINVFSNYWKKLVGKTDIEISKNKERAKNNFKLKFNDLTDNEIEKKLKNHLVDEAKQALLEIQNERNNAL